MKIICCNGIRSDGGDNTDLLIKDLANEGFKTVDCNYPRVGFLTSYSKKRQYKNAEILYHLHNPGDHLVAHSYAGLIARRAMHLGAQFGVVILLSPAMDVDFSFPPNGAQKIICLHNPHDRAIKVGSLLPGHPFGNAGRFGFKNKGINREVIDQRIENIKETPKEKEFWRHSNFALDSNRPAIVQFIKESIHSYEKKNNSTYPR